MICSHLWNLHPTFYVAFFFKHGNCNFLSTVRTSKSKLGCFTYIYDATFALFNTFFKHGCCILILICPFCNDWIKKRSDRTLILSHPSCYFRNISFALIKKLYSSSSINLPLLFCLYSNFRSQICSGRMLSKEHFCDIRIFQTSLFKNLNFREEIKLMLSRIFASPPAITSRTSSRRVTVMCYSRMNQILHHSFPPILLRFLSIFGSYP